MSHWVLVDLSWLTYRALYSFGGTQLEHNDFKTGVMFGVFEALRTTCFHPKVMSNRVVIFRDSRSSVRKLQFPGYKSNRSEMSDEDRAKREIMYAQVDMLVDEVFPKIGFPTVHQEGMESDDLMAQAAKALLAAGETGVMITADGDLFQCITEAVHWFNPSANKYYDPQSFLAEKKITPELWREVKALAGCGGDSVPGIEGAGEVSAVKYLTNRLPPHYAVYKKIESAEGQAIAERNRELVILPHKQTNPVVLSAPVYHPEEFYTFCERFGMQSFLQGNRRHEWERFFQGNLRKQPTRRRGESHQIPGPRARARDLNLSGPSASS